MPARLLVRWEEKNERLHPAHSRLQRVELFDEARTTVIPWVAGRPVFAQRGANERHRSSKKLAKATQRAF